MAPETPRPEVVLGEIEDLLRNLPSREQLRQSLPENFSFLGRAVAALASWNPVLGSTARSLSDNLRSGLDSWAPYDAFAQLLHEAHTDLRLKLVGPVSTAIDAGMVFDYFDEIRKVIQTARSDLLFVDPYLDDEFVSRYLSVVTPTVPIRLLARERLATLLPAVQALGKQRGTPIRVRSAASFHDRYVIVDGASCYQSGASFKDGGNKPTTITQITDAFSAVRQTYEDLWQRAKVEL